MANSRQETEKMMAAGGSIINGTNHDGSLTLSPANGQNATLMRHSPDIKKHPHTHPHSHSHSYDKPVVVLLDILVVVFCGHCGITQQVPLLLCSN
ncbi:hypothetical protein ACLKA6_011798 [Drosophila palustris]